MMKLYSAILTKAEAEGDNDIIDEVNQMLQDKLPAFAESADLEVQERVGVKSVLCHSKQVSGFEVERNAVVMESFCV